MTKRKFRSRSCASDFQNASGRRKIGRKRGNELCSNFTFHVLLFTLLGFSVYVCFAGAAYSQNIRVLAAVTPKIITLDETATLRVTISGDTQFNRLQPPKLKLPPELGASYGGSSSQYNLSGGRIAVSMTWTYLLRGKKAGKFILPRIQIPYGGKTYTTDPITIEVLARSQKPGPSESRANTFTDTFNGGVHKVEAFVDNTQPYVNEQITYTFRYLYNTRIPSLDSPKYTLPAWTRFWEKTLDQKSNRREVVDGTPYWVAEIRVALFPIAAGKTRIEPAKLSLPTSVGFGRIDGLKVLVTDPIEIDVRPLPQSGKPATFTGAVGQYQISAQADRLELEAGDGLTLRVQISGQGNIETLTPPAIPALPNMTVYDPKITDAIGEVGSEIQGRRTYEYVIIPSKAGNWTIPAIAYPYFHPQTESYQIARTVPMTINVMPNPNGAIGTTTTQTVQSDVRVLKQDIRYIKPDSLKLTDQSVYPHKRASFWALQIVPVIVVLATWLYQQQRAKRDFTQLRRQQAAKKALSAIEAVEKQISRGPAAAFAALATGLYQYIGDIFDLSPTGLNPELARQQCEAAGLSEAVTTRLVEVLTQCDYVRFAPVAANPTDTENALNRAKTAIYAIEKERQNID
ncbi:MAG: BatD family protein [Candidatus Poribacteria bacterium]|nr:BatD family protein [Candidatus Poribacteria bacterium]